MPSSGSRTQRKICRGRGGAAVSSGKSSLETSLVSGSGIAASAASAAFCAIRSEIASIMISRLRFSSGVRGGTVSGSEEYSARIAS